MKAIQNIQVYDRLYGIQLAVFEMVWPKPWLSAILMKASKKSCTVYAKTNRLPSTEEWESSTRLMGEILEVALTEIGVAFEMRYGEPGATPQELDIIMDEQIFKAIAKDHAPWRLE